MGRHARNTCEPSIKSDGHSNWSAPPLFHLPMIAPQPPDTPNQPAEPIPGRASRGDAVQEYDRRAVDLAGLYESVAFEQVHADVLDLLPPEPSAILDVGAGSGRDAAWFAARGHEVVAVEPSCGMRGEAARRHGSPRIRWIDDRLPGLERGHRLGMAIDLILLSAVWMHVGLADRRWAFRKLVTLIKPGGRMVVSLRHGPPDPSRLMHPVSRAEIERLAAEHGAVVTRATWAPDAGGRPDIQWETVAVQLVDDGTGALPLIRHIVLNDAKAKHLQAGPPARSGAHRGRLAQCRGPGSAAPRARGALMGPHLPPLGRCRPATDPHEPERRQPWIRSGRLPAAGGNGATNTEVCRIALAADGKMLAVVLRRTSSLSSEMSPNTSGCAASTAR
ncbi:class I SAM-dependent methyltransferase [Azospirillum sp. Marseille-Q6669]